jgi:hypothetical protein
VSGVTAVSPARMACSFCAKTSKEVSRLIANNPTSLIPVAYICDECIGLCNDILSEKTDAEREAEDAAAEPAALNTEPPTEPLLTPAEVAAVLRCSIATAKRIMSRHHPVYVGRLVRWPRAELADFLERGGVAVVRGRRP